MIVRATRRDDSLVRLLKKALREFLHRTRHQKSHKPYGIEVWLKKKDNP